MSTTLDPQFLVATMQIAAFKNGPMLRAQGALLTLALESPVPITAADLPGEITNGNTHLAGAAAGGLIAQDLLRATGERVKSPHPNAKGRKLNQLTVPDNRRATARTWLTANGFPAARPVQLTLLTA